MLFLHSKLQNHLNGTVHTGIVAQLGQGKFSTFRSVEGRINEVLLHSVEQDLARLGDPAADNVDFWVKDAGYGSQGSSQSFADKVHDFQSQLIAFLSRVKDGLGVKLVYPAQA